MKETEEETIKIFYKESKMVIGELNITDWLNSLVDIHTQNTIPEQECILKPFIFLGVIKINHSHYCQFLLNNKHMSPPFSIQKIHLHKRFKNFQYRKNYA